MVKVLSEGSQPRLALAQPMLGYTLRLDGDQVRARGDVEHVLGCDGRAVDRIVEVVLGQQVETWPGVNALAGKRSALNGTKSSMSKREENHNGT